MLRWNKPTVFRVQRIIKHPAYAGYYIYGRQHWRRVQEGAAPPPEHQVVGQFVLLPDHHEAYIAAEEYERNQRTLALNTNTPFRSQPGRGRSLLQGIVHCARHGAMVTRYYVHGPGGWFFKCQGDYLDGGKACVSVTGRILEKVVVVLVLQSIDVPIIEEARRLWHEEHADADQMRRARRRALAQKRAERDVIAERLTSGRPDLLPQVFQLMQKRFVELEDEIARFELDDQTDAQRAARLDEQQWARLVDLCDRLDDIWRAPTTTVQDKKRVIRTLVRRVLVVEVDAERIRGVIEWADGAPSCPIEVLRPAYYHQRILDWHCAGVGPDVMVQRLAEMGGRTQQDRPWSLETVRRTLAILVQHANRSPGDGPPVPEIKGTRERMRELDALGMPARQIAERLNADGVLTRFGNPWSEASVTRCLGRRAAREVTKRKEAKEGEP